MMRRITDAEKAARPIAQAALEERASAYGIADSIVFALGAARMLRPPAPDDSAGALAEQRLAEIASRAEAATVCPEAGTNGRQDGQHTWTGSSFTHTQCELCRYTRPRGERAEETIALLAEITRLRWERDAVWTVWGEDSPEDSTLYSTKTAAELGTIARYEAMEGSCPDYSWRHSDEALELLAGGEPVGIYLERTDVHGERDDEPVPYELADDRNDVLAVRWDRLVTHPAADSGEPTIVCCIAADTGQPVALVLDDEHREALGLSLVDPNGEMDQAEALPLATVTEGGERS